jgi:hypothetical protein
MNRYFFHVTPYEPTTDVEGTMLENDAEAWKEATVHAAELFKDIDGNFRPGQSWSLEVMNEQKKMLFTIKITSTGDDPAA